jgi:hypothetical protein
MDWEYYSDNTNIKDFLLDYDLFDSDYKLFTNIDEKFIAYKYINNKNYRKKISNSLRSHVINYNYKDLTHHLDKNKLNKTIIADVSRSIFVKINNENIYNIDDININDIESKKNEIIKKLDSFFNEQKNKYENLNNLIDEGLISMIKFTIGKSINYMPVNIIYPKTLFEKYPFLSLFQIDKKNFDELIYVAPSVDEPVYIYIDQCQTLKRCSFK